MDELTSARPWTFSGHFLDAAGQTPVPAQETETLTRDITTAGVGLPSPGGLVGSAPIASTTSCP